MKKYPLGNYGLSIVLFSLFFVSWIAQTVFGWYEFKSEQQDHNKQATVAEYLPKWGEATMENWQSEFLQLFTFVVLTTYLIHRGSHESRDEGDEMKEKLEKIEKMLEEMQNEGESSSKPSGKKSKDQAKLI